MIDTQKKKAFENFSSSGFRADPLSGLFVPESVPLNDVKTLISDISKSDEATRAAFEKRIDRKLGTLYSTWYSLFASTVSHYGAANKPQHTAPMTLLRQAFRQSLIDQVIINARVQQVKMVCERVITPKRQKGWSVKSIRHADPYYKPTKSDLERIKEVEDVILHPWVEVHPDFRDFLVKATQSQLIIDRNCMPIVRDSKGKPLRWYLIPPDQVKPRYDILYRYMQQHGLTDVNRGVESFYQTTNVDLTDIAFVQELETLQIAGAWKQGEIEIDITNPSDELDHMGYGVSMFERSMEATAILLYAMKYQKEYFLKNYPDQMLVINGEVDPTGLELFKQSIYASAGPQGNQRFPILPLNDEDYKVQLLRLTDTAVDMQLISLIRFLVAIKCASFRMHPSTINLAPDMGERGSIIADAQDQADILGSMVEEGLKSLLQSIGHFLNRAIINPWYDDIVFTWEVEDVPPEEKRIAMWTQKVAMGVMADEFRADEGLPPLEEASDGRYSGQVPLSPFILQDKELEMQTEMMEQQAELEEQRIDNSGFTGGGNPTPSGGPSNVKGTKEKPPKPKSQQPKARPKTKPKAKSKVKKSLGILSYLIRRSD